jgi:ribosomal protein L13E
VKWFYEQRKQGRLVPITIEGRRIIPASGFSVLELKRAGITLEAAKDLNLPIDRIRQTSIGTNVLQLCEVGPVAPQQVTVMSTK